MGVEGLSEESMNKVKYFEKGVTDFLEGSLPPYKKKYRPAENPEPDNSSIIFSILEH